MSVITIIVKTIVRLVYGVIQLFGVVAEGAYKLSTNLNDCLVAFDDKMAKEFKKKKEQKTEEVPA